MLSSKDIEDIEDKIGYKFNNKQLLNTSFMHSSLANMINEESNERLEFLGDSILNFVTTEYLYAHYTQNEGHLSRAKAYLVSAKNLSKYIKKIKIIEYLQCKALIPGSSENVMGDLFEAILGAMYLDCKDIDVCRNFIVDRLNYDHQNLQIIYSEMQDYKTLLQELIQKDPKNRFVYMVKEVSGPPHKPVYTIGYVLNNSEIASATAIGKKEAENKCAKYVYEMLKDKIS